MLTIEERLKEIYETYTKVLCPYIVKYELLVVEFPAEILNEIRAIFTHLSKYYLSDDASIKEKNVSKAEGHMKRALLDCYKYICVAFDYEYIKFEKRYERVNLSFIDNGEFLPKLLHERQRSIELMTDAKKTDLIIDSDDEINSDEAYKKYEKAFVAYSSVYDIVNNSYKKLENLKKKVVIKDFFSVGGWVIGIIGLIATILSIIF